MEHARVMYNREIATAVDINTGMMMEATACINYVVIGDKKSMDTR